MISSCNFKIASIDGWGNGEVPDWASGCAWNLEFRVLFPDVPIVPATAYRGARYNSGAPRRHSSLSLAIPLSWLINLARFPAIL